MEKSDKRNFKEKKEKKAYNTWESMLHVMNVNLLIIFSYELSCFEIGSGDVRQSGKIYIG